MKKLFLLAILSVALLACSDEAETPLKPNFEVTVTGEAPNATITIVNNSNGADSYEWTFGEGFSTATSADAVPAGIIADKTGTLQIKLKVIKGSKSLEATKEVTVTGNNAVLSFTDLSFALNSNSTEFGQFFSVETGQVIKASALTTELMPKVSLAFNSMENTMYYFESPSVREEVTSGSVAKVINWESTPTFTTEGFNAIVDDSDLKDLSITDTNDSFGNSSIPGTVLFEIADGRKGVIKTTSVNSSRLLVDIKIQKY